jgi:hypothetical protein
MEEDKFYNTHGNFIVQKCWGRGEETEEYKFYNTYGNSRCIRRCPTPRRRWRDTQPPIVDDPIGISHIHFAIRRRWHRGRTTTDFDQIVDAPARAVSFAI